MLRASEKLAPRVGAIRSAALQVFLRQGYAATTIRDIAEEAGLGVTIVRGEVGDKADLLAVLASDWLEIAWNAARRAIHAEGSVDRRIHGALAAHLHAVQATFRRSRHAAEIQEAAERVAPRLLARHRRRISVLLRQALEESRQRGDVTLPPDVCPVDIVEVLLARCFELQRACNSPPEKGNRGLTRLIRIVLNGLGVSPAEAGPGKARRKR